jgi:ABC-type transport system involved in multi-copper enzyme maturation permease subunit
MLSLIKIEWLKIRKYPAFWWMFGIVALTYPGINALFYNIYSSMASSPNSKKGAATGMIEALLGRPFSFPEAWHSVAFFSSIFVVIPATLVIMLIANEYNFKTHRQNIIDGWSRDEFVLSKLCDVAIISVFTTLAYMLTALGFGLAYSSDIAITRWAENMQYIPLFLLQTFAQLTIAFLFGFLIKRSFIALGAFLFYFLVLDETLQLLFRKYLMVPEAVTHYFPLEMSDRIIPQASFMGTFSPESYAKKINEISQFAICTCVFTAGIWALCFYLNRKRDL